MPPVSELITEAVREPDDARRQGLRGMADHWVEAARCQRQNNLGFSGAPACSTSHYGGETIASGAAAVPHKLTKIARQRGGDDQRLSQICGRHRC